MCERSSALTMQLRLQAGAWRACGKCQNRHRRHSRDAVAGCKLWLNRDAGERVRTRNCARRWGG